MEENSETLSSLREILMACRKTTNIMLSEAFLLTIALSLFRVTCTVSINRGVEVSTITFRVYSVSHFASFDDND
jgi:hypothetical protein